MAAASPGLEPLRGYLHDAKVRAKESDERRKRGAGANGPVEILNPGSSGYAHLPEKDRTAHLCFYTVEDGQLSQVERLTYDGTAFVPEPGGAFATGR